MSEALDCARHGKGVATFVCTHLNEGIACGFLSDPPTREAPWPDAWCDACEVTRARAGEWSDDVHPDVVAICNGCYVDVRDRNRLVPPELVGATAMSAEAVDRLVEGACRIVQGMQERARELFSFGAHDRWGADYDAGLFMLKKGREVRIHAELQIVGSYSLPTRSWLWSWANKINEPHNVSDVALLPALGKVRGIDLLVTDYQENVDEAHCWHLTSLACYLLGYEACYRAPMDDRYLFFILNNLRWVT